MTCDACGFENPSGMKFCGACAAPLTNRCPQCGSENPPGFKFCGQCAAELSGLGVTEKIKPITPNPLTPSPLAYTPKHLADKILQSRSALEGERKQVTVLFADVKGSMDLAEQLDPEAWHGILDRFFEVLTDGVHRFEGTVNQYTGDGIMALFGAPIAHEDHAHRACYAALHLRDAVREYANQVRVEHGVPFGVRIGLNSGEVVVGKIGHDLRMDYTAQGHVVGLAQRMEALAESGHICLSEHTARLVEGYFQLQDLGRTKVKGVNEPVGLFDLAGVGPFRTRLDRSQAYGFSRFVGRQDEMATLEAALARALAGHGQVVGVVAEAGVGKSRLCTEFVERCVAQRIAVVGAHCPAHGKVVPLLPVLELLRGYFGIVEQDQGRAAREKIAGRLLLLDPGFQEGLPLVFDFLGVPDPERPVAAMDPEARQRQLYAFVRRLVQARSEQEPAVVFVDDLHWIDPVSDGFVAQLVDAVVATRTLFLVNFRPEYAADWTRKSYYQQLPLVPLGPAAVAELVRDHLGTDASVAALPALIQSRAAGNPFFTEEILRSLIETGHLAGSRGSYRLVRPINALEVPSTVQSLLAARIDRLGEQEKHVLQAAAVIGREFTVPVLSAVVGAVRDAPLPTAALSGALSALEAAEFIVAQALYPVAEYRFKHPLTEQVAREQQLHERRRRLHRAAAQALEAAHAERLDENAALIAYHWAEAGEALAAARWHRRAAEWARLGNPVEADAHYRKVDALMESLPRSAEADTLRLAAILGRIDLAWRVGMSEDDADALFARGALLARERGDLRSLALLEGKFGSLKGLHNQFEAMLLHLRQAIAAARELGDVGLEVAFLSWEMRGLGWLSRGPEMLAVRERGRELAGGDLRAGFEVFGSSPLLLMDMLYGNALAAIGMLPESVALFEQSIRTAHELADHQLLGFLNGDATLAHAFRGDAAQALAHSQRAVEIEERLGGAAQRAHAAFYLCWARAAAEDWNGVVDSAERAAAISRETGIGLEWHGPLLALRSAAELGLGNPAAARASARAAIAVMRERGNRNFEWMGHLALARALMRPADAAELDEAESVLSAATDAVMDAGFRACVPVLREARAELARLRGDDATAERELRGAHRQFAEMGATGHVERLARAWPQLLGARA